MLLTSALPTAVQAFPNAGDIAVLPTPNINDMGDIADAPRIMVIGVGGGGNNAVDYMINHHVSGVEFIRVNTDLQSLKSGRAEKIIQLGTSGLGTGGNPDLARLAATQSEHDLRCAMDGANILFICAGLGGGTGTGAAPIIACMANEMGILTVFLGTLPFEFEGRQRVNTACAGLADLQDHVDALFIVPNEKLLTKLGGDVTMAEAFTYTNSLMKDIVSSFAEILNLPSHVNVDFEDVRTLLKEPGKAALGVAVVSGLDRAHVAAEKALNFPLMDGLDLSSAKSVMVMISAAKGTLKLSEFKLVMKSIRTSISSDAYLICGTTQDESLDDGLRVTVIATGLKPLEI